MKIEEEGRRIHIEPEITKHLWLKSIWDWINTEFRPTVLRKIPLELSLVSNPYLPAGSLGQAT